MVTVNWRFSLVYKFIMLEYTRLCCYSNLFLFDSTRVFAAKFG